MSNSFPYYNVYIYISIQYTQYVYIYIYIIQPFFCDVTITECSRRFRVLPVPCTQIQEIPNRSSRYSDAPDYQITSQSQTSQKQTNCFFDYPLYNMKGGETHGRMLTRESIGVHGSHHIKFKMLHLLAVARTETECFLHFHAPLRRNLCNCKL